MAWVWNGDPTAERKNMGISRLIGLFFSFFLSKSIFPQIIRIWMKKTRVICGDDYEAKKYWNMRNCLRNILWCAVHNTDHIINSTYLNQYLKSFAPTILKEDLQVHWSVGLTKSDRHARVKNLKNAHLWYYSCHWVCVSVTLLMFGSGVEGGVTVRLGVVCPCPLVRNDIVTPRHLF